MTTYIGGKRVEHPHDLISRESWKKLVHGAERMLGGEGRETAAASMDCDYGHDLICEALDEFAAQVLADAEANR